MGYELLKEATAIDDHRVAVTFTGGRTGVFDCRPYFGMGYYKPLNNPALFKCVTVSHGWLNWPVAVWLTQAQRDALKRMIESGAARDMSDFVIKAIEAESKKGKDTK